MRPRTELILIVGGTLAAGLLLAVCGGGIFLLNTWPKAPARSPNTEHDGTRPLINRYELTMIKSSPRSVLGPDPGVGKEQVWVPDGVLDAATEQVTLYAISGDLIVGRLDPVDPFPLHLFKVTAHAARP